MHFKKYGQHILMGVSIFSLIIFVSLMFLTVHRIQGTARVINYAGIVRGATQSVVKNELYGIADDAKIERLDSILYDLQHTDGSHGLTVLADENYQKKLEKLVEKWELLKENIYAAREDERIWAQVYTISESHFVLADQAVSAAESYADGAARQLGVIEQLVILNILVLLLLLFYQIATEVVRNRKLSRIAYVDANTGLPNKRKCEEMLSADELLDEDDVVCCFMFDLNNLKIVNDTMGHKTGDALIMHFASVLKRAAPADMFIGRFGGDEFIGIWHHTNEEKVHAFLEKLHQEISTVNSNVERNYITISFAYGYALSSTQYHCTVKTLMDLADQNMYDNKRKTKTST